MTMKTYYVSREPSGKNIGTKSDPFGGPDFDAAVQKIKAAGSALPSEPTRIIVGPGTYSTRGIAPEANWDLRLHAGTTLRLSDIGASGFRHPTNCVIATSQFGKADGPAWLETFAIKGGTLDCNWLGQSERMTAGEKFAGLYILSAKTRIRGVTVINAGSNGNTVPGAQPFEFSECFPIMAETYADEATTILIDRCTVRDQQWAGGGYATGIMVRTTQDLPDQDRGDRIKWIDGPRKTICATVSNNVCDWIYGSGFGCGFSERVNFLDNVARKCKTFANIDSGRNRLIKFRRNRALACNQGIHVGNFYDGEFDDFTIESNLFHLTGTWRNQFLPQPQTEYSFGVRLTKLPKRAVIKGNTFTGWPVKSAPNGRYGIGACDGAEVPVMLDNTFCGFEDQFVTDAAFHILET